MKESSQIVYSPREIDFDSAGKRHYQVAFPLDSAWGYSLMPLTVVRGPASRANTAGVAVIGGTHGNEYEGQIAVKRLCAELDAAAMSGLAVLIPQLSESAARAGTRVSPLDSVNMNRAFPGNPRGTVSYRIAHFVKTELFPLVKAVIDIHSGGREAVFPLCTSIHRTADAGQTAEMAKTARLFGTPVVFLYSSDMASGLLTDEAEAAGLIAIGGEFGFGETVNPAGVRHAFEGSLNVMRKYGVLDGELRIPPPIGDARQRLVEAPNLVDYRPCPRDGIWEPLLKPGCDVAEGELLGRLHDFADHSEPALEIRAHRAGVLIAQFSAAQCSKGLTLFVIGQETEFPE